MSDNKQDASGGESCCACSLDSRRTMLAATVGAGAVVGLGVATPFVASFMPSERAKAAGAPVEVDLSKIKAGEMITVEWQGKPVWILRRTPEMIAALSKNDAALADPASERAVQPEYVKGVARAIKDEFFVCLGVCTHLGCSPNPKFAVGSESGMGDAWNGGFLCPCHGSQFDLAGRVFKSMPAPTNLVIPPHAYLSDTRLLIGKDSAEA
ncbi:ubiquinol-cytochrome c reductase iron-sulfur subunit [Uliginosibacterium sp. 31-16]|uniref:ubiquinol-cytochrome c reductase iron-sulfur subunit n=1 Tax=Uliginosibacterium sp. 31-16 TaxID=3068315 RepID=UPI00353209A0